MTQRGDLAVILPDPAPVHHETGSPGLDPHSSILDVGSSPHGVSWFGEITDNCLDGDVIVRLGAADEACDVKVSADRILLVASEEEESESEYTDEEDYDSNWSEVSNDDTDADQESDVESTIDVMFEDEDGNEIVGGDDEDASMWTTDEEEDEVSGDQLFDTEDQKPTYAADPVSTSPGISSPDSHEGAVIYSNHPSMPSQFSILDHSPPSDHHYINSARILTADLMRRIRKENAIMQNSLPDGVFVRSWDTRLDLLRILIIGPHDTPYEFAPFVFDLQYGESFPTSPPDVFFHSWTNKIGKINPNLYEDGTICLSLLGTWDSGDRDEEWSSKKSTILQLLVSILGLVLVKEPYFSKYLLLCTTLLLGVT